MDSEETLLTEHIRKLPGDEPSEVGVVSCFHEHVVLSYRPSLNEHKEKQYQNWKKSSPEFFSFFALRLGFSAKDIPVREDHDRHIAGTYSGSCSLFSAQSSFISFVATVESNSTHGSRVNPEFSQPSS